MSIVKIALLASAAALAFAQAPQVSSEQLSQLHYRYIGPVGNRVISVAGIPGDPNIYYVGAASGGIFKTTDGGTNWQPIFDSQEVSSVGSLAVAAADPNLVWAGTGETFIRSHISVGNGTSTTSCSPPTAAASGFSTTSRRWNG